MLVKTTSQNRNHFFQTNFCQRKAKLACGFVSCIKLSPAVPIMTTGFLIIIPFEWYLKITQQDIFQIIRNSCVKTSNYIKLSLLWVQSISILPSRFCFRKSKRISWSRSFDSLLSFCFTWSHLPYFVCFFTWNMQHFLCIALFF